jgi:hypothetical protein
MATMYHQEGKAYIVKSWCALLALVNKLNNGNQNEVICIVELPANSVSIGLCTSFEH